MTVIEIDIQDFGGYDDKQLTYETHIGDDLKRPAEVSQSGTSSSLDKNKDIVVEFFDSHLLELLWDESGNKQDNRHVRKDWIWSKDLGLRSEWEMMPCRNDKSGKQMWRW